MLHRTFEALQMILLSLNLPAIFFKTFQLGKRLAIQTENLD